MADSESLANHTIALDLDLSDKYEELRAGGTIFPGQLVYVSTSQQVEKHATAGAEAERLFVVENVYEGKTMYQEYTLNERVMMRICHAGAVILTKLTSGIGGNVLYSMPLASDGTGWLREHQVTDTAPALAISLEEDIGATFPRWTRIRIL